MIPIASPDIGEDEIQAVQEVMQTGIIAAGPKTKKFEQQFANYCGVKNAIMVSSGTAALHVAMMAAGLKAGDEVITSPFTFIATANSIQFVNAKPVFADILEDTFCIDPESIREKITENTKAIIPVHLYGHPAEMDEIIEIAQENDLAIIEDACQAHGAVYKGKKVGGFGTGCFSFYPTKNMTTSEGGMITTNDEDIDLLCRKIRQHGMEKRYHHDILGHNFRSTDICAAIGEQQLRKLPEYNKKRQENAKYLSDGIVNENVVVPKVQKDCEHVFHQYTIRCKDRDSVIKAFEEAEIGYGIYYPIPIHQQKSFKALGFDETHPVTEKLTDEVLSIPVHPKLMQDDLEKIVEVLNSI